LKKAKQEFEIFNKTVEEPIVDKTIQRAILKFIKKFEKQSQDSGGTIHYTINSIVSIIRNLLLQRPICPLTFKDDEWSIVSDNSGNGPVYQNKRESGVFKDGTLSRPYYLYGIAFKAVDNDWDQFSGKVEDISSTCYFKKNILVGSDQAYPKTFYIDVKAVKCGRLDDNGWFEASKAYPFIHKYVIANPDQLDEVRKHYDLDYGKEQEMWG
jgi:hypothetical protein